MHRKGMNPENVLPEDILCDFCGRAAWADNEPCVEGHQGSVICGNCLTKAYQSVVVNLVLEEPNDTCRMCLEEREDPVWIGSFEPIATICKRCIKQSAGVLVKSKHWEWAKPS